MKEIKWAVLGCGVIANEMAVALQKNGKNIYAVGNRTHEKAAAFAEKYGIGKVYDDFHEMFTDPEVDVIYITTPHNTHLGFMKEAIANGKHILVEKSITLNSDELDEAIALAKEKGVLSATQKELHRGVNPEEKIIECMNKALAILNDKSIECVFRISIFHYLFGYIHPFYDGNGRTSRFISSYLLSKEFESIIGYRMSYSIKENINDYYKAFKVCNDPKNKGDLTPFIIMFTDIIDDSLHKLVYALEKRLEQLTHYGKCIIFLPKGADEKYSDLYFLLIQASLFSESGISTKELMDVMKLSRSTVTNRLNTLSDYGLIIKKTLGNIRCYSLDIDKIDTIMEEKNK